MNVSVGYLRQRAGEQLLRSSMHMCADLLDPRLWHVASDVPTSAFHVVSKPVYRIHVYLSGPKTIRYVQGVL